MRLSSWLFTTLLFASGGSAFRCATTPLSTKVPEFRVCATSNQTELRQPDNVFANECQFLFNPPLVSCHHSIPASALCWRALDTDGTVEVVFPLLPYKCHYSSYEAILMVAEGSRKNCHPSRYDSKKHSDRTVCIIDCKELSCTKNCSQNGWVRFQHVFSGCYQLTITPYRNQQSYVPNQLETSLTYLDTGHVKTPIPAEAVMITNVAHTSLYLQATFTTNPTAARFKLMQDIDKTKGGDACRESGSCIATCDTVLGSRHIQCDSGNKKLAISCSYQSESVVSCEFSQLKEGNYCVRLTLDDDRCHHNTVWDNDDYNFSMCTWQTEILEVVSAVESLEKRQITPNFPPGLLILGLVFVSGSVAVLWWILRQRQSSQEHKFSLVTSQLPESPRVLLLYARDCPAFLQSIAHLRSLLKTACKFEVFDCWEEQQYSRLAEGPSHWIMSQLADSRLRILLVISPASSRLETGLVTGAPVCYQQPRAFDGVLCHTLTYLHENYAHEKYNTLFIIRLEEMARNGTIPLTRTYLNPLTIYELPVHLNALLANLQNMNPTECKISDELECDVRQLSAAISQYRQYLQDQPRYLDTLLMADNRPCPQD